MNTLRGVCLPRGAALPLKRLLLCVELLAFFPSSVAGFWGYPSVQDAQLGPRSTRYRDAFITVTLGKQLVPVKVQNRTVAHKTAYFGTVYAGHPAQSFTVVFDTGSGHFILPSVACESETCKMHRRYNRTLSRSSQDIEYDGSPIKPGTQERDQVAISFGTGEISGEFVEEVVCLGDSYDPAGAGGDEGRGCARVRTVLATDMTADPFQLFSFDGVLGLGLDPLVLRPEFSFFGQISRGHPGMAPIFAVHLAADGHGAGEISLGGHDPRHLAADAALRWTPVANPELGYWQVPIRGIRVGDDALEVCADGSCRAILDTGTSLLGVPRQIARDLHWMLARPLKDYKNEIDCRDMPGPSLTFDMGDFAVQLDAKDYTRPAAARMKPDGADTAGIFCRASLLPVDMKAPLGSKVFIFGEPFLRRYYTAYNWATREIGFGVAAAGTPCEPSAGGSRGGCALPSAELSGADRVLA